jgi:hypothetical protein
MTLKTRQCRAWLLAAIAAVAAALLPALAAGPARAFSGGLALKTYNRPSTVEWGGTEYMAYADQTGPGHVHVVKFNSDGTVRTEWTSTSTSTYLATGPTIAVSNGAIVVTWADSGGWIHIAEPVGTGGFGCEAVINQDFWNNSPSLHGGVPFEQTGVTPYLTSEGDDGAGNLYLTVGDAISNMHVVQLSVPTPAQCVSSADVGFFAINVVGISTADTTWDGPAMVVSGYKTSSEHFWLMWAGTDSGHHLNIAEFTSAWVRMGKGTETSHSTLTDMGGAYFTAQGTVAMSYCGTNNVPYVQRFTTTAGGAETQILSGASCDINKDSPTTGVTFYSGGVGVGYEYDNKDLVYTWADATSYQIIQF